VQLLFKGSDSGDGWKPSDFHRKCDNQGATLTLVKSSAGRLFGGFASIGWQSRTSDHYAKDQESFIFSIDLKTTYRPTNIEKALWLYRDSGPSFGGNAFVILGSQLNTKGNSHCFTNAGGVGNYYNIRCDTQGNNVVTGEGREQKTDEKRFTCLNLEVFKVIY
jgi:hypothetical protein